MPAFKEHYKALNFEVVAVSDLWNRRRDEAAEFFKKEFATDVTLYRNNEELYEKSQSTRCSSAPPTSSTPCTPSRP